MIQRWAGNYDNDNVFNEVDIQKEDKKFKEHVRLKDYVNPLAKEMVCSGTDMSFGHETHWKLM